MKKRLIQIALILGLMALTCAAAQATETAEPTSGFREVKVESAYENSVTLTPVDARNADVTKADVRYPGAVKMKVAYNGAQSGNEQYTRTINHSPKRGMNTTQNDSFTSNENIISIRRLSMANP